MLLPVSGSATPAAHRFSNLLDQFFAPDASARPALPLGMWQDENAVYVEADTPGLTDQDFDVSVHGRVLTIRGERKSAGHDGRFDTRSYGRFEQRVGLPAPVDADRVEAKLANGVLALTLPKSEAAKPRKISVRAA